METFLIRALQLIMSLSLLVIVHEGGHFLFARLFKTRVEKFCLFFDPWFTLFKFKPKNSDTEYGIGCSSALVLAAAAAFLGLAP